MRALIKRGAVRVLLLSVTVTGFLNSEARRHRPKIGPLTIEQEIRFTLPEGEWFVPDGAPSTTAAIQEVLLQNAINSYVEDMLANRANYEVKVAREIQGRLVEID